jgi:DNA invertase Pin-like site-specific DNA recombinase
MTVTSSIVCGRAHPYIISPKPVDLIDNSGVGAGSADPRLWWSPGDLLRYEERGTRIGYTRVSTVSQTLEQQNAALTAAGVTKTFSDTMSGARDDRPGLAGLLEYMREGDTVVVWKLDRLGRNTLHILETVKALTDRGVTLVSTTDGIDSGTAAGRMMIGVLGSLAEYERELTKERTALKRQASRANGTAFGRPRKVDDAEHIATAKRMKADGHTGRDIAKYLGVSRATLYRYLTEDSAA